MAELLAQMETKAGPSNDGFVSIDMDLEYELTNVAFHHVSRDPMGILV
jgi:hypothetical protein